MAREEPFLGSPNDHAVRGLLAEMRMVTAEAQPSPLSTWRPMRPRSRPTQFDLKPLHETPGAPAEVLKARRNSATPLARESCLGVFQEWSVGRG